MNVPSISFIYKTLYKMQNGYNMIYVLRHAGRGGVSAYWSIDQGKNWSTDTLDRKVSAYTYMTDDGSVAIISGKDPNGNNASSDLYFRSTNISAGISSFLPLPRTSNMPFIVVSLCYGNPAQTQNGVFIMSGINTSPVSYVASYSIDKGLTWTLYPPNTFNGTGIGTVVYNGTNFIATRSSDTNTPMPIQSSWCYTSTNGITWTASTPNNLITRPAHIATFKNLAVAVGSIGTGVPNVVVISTNYGRQWKSIGTNYGSITSIIHTGSKFVMFGFESPSSNQPVLYFSEDDSLEKWSKVLILNNDRNGIRGAVAPYAII